MANRAEPRSKRVFCFGELFSNSTHHLWKTRSGETLASGNEAFQKYADVSVPAMQDAGGSFLTVSAFAGTMLGAEQDWDLVAIGRYPNLQAFLGLYQNPEYIRAFDYRIAAVASQFVIVIEQ